MNTNKLKLNVSVIYMIGYAIIVFVILSFITGTMIEYIAVKLNQPVPDNILTDISNAIWTIIGYMP